jgi:hypothetical protein
LNRRHRIRQHGREQMQRACACACAHSAAPSPMTARTLSPAEAVRRPRRDNARSRFAGVGNRRT